MTTTPEQRAEWKGLENDTQIPKFVRTALPALIYHVEALEAENASLKAFAAWASSGDTGLSSECLARHMLGLGAKGRYGVRHPLDTGDFSRCYDLLEAVPAWKPRIREMAVYSPEWAVLAKEWGALSEAYASEDHDRVNVIIRRARAAMGATHD